MQSKYNLNLSLNVALPMILPKRITWNFIHQWIVLTEKKHLFYFRLYILKSKDVKFTAEDFHWCLNNSFFFNQNSFYVPELIEIQGDCSCHNMKDLHIYRLSGITPQVSKVFSFCFLYVCCESFQRYNETYLSRICLFTFIFDMSGCLNNQLKVVFWIAKCIHVY